MSDQTTGPRYRHFDGSPDYEGKTREDWVKLWAKLPTWNETWAAVRFDELVESGTLVEVVNGKR